jgi:hypothetical protein
VADIIGDGNEAWWFLPSVANIASVTTSEFTGGVRISQWMTKDGATGFQPDTADAPTSGKESVFDTATNGRISFSSPRFTFKKQDGVDTAYNTLSQNATGYAVRRNSMAATATVASTQKLEVYPIICSARARVDQDDNQPEKYMVPVKITSAPNLNAVVA